MRGFKFHNGQIVGDLETRPTDKDHVKDYYAFEVIPIAGAALPNPRCTRLKSATC